MSRQVRGMKKPVWNPNRNEEIIMKQYLAISFLVVGVFTGVFGQNTLELTFTAADHGQYVLLDSVVVENLTHGGDTTLYWPDTVLVLDYITGVDGDQAISENTFFLSQNYPNPFVRQTSVDLTLAEAELIEITIRDILGKELLHYKNRLSTGNHSFAFYPGNEMYYLLTATGKQQNQTIKMVHTASNMFSGGKCNLVYTGNKGNLSGLRSQHAVNDFVFTAGDELLYTGYAQTMEGVAGNNVITDAPQTNTDYTFAIIKGYRCPLTPTVTDIDGNVYPTVQINSFCWMAENLKTTTYNNGIPIPNITTNWQFMTTGAYTWYDNNSGFKDLYGAIYNWYAAVNPNGLCPVGWHVPTFDEWTAFGESIGGAGPPHGNELKSCRQVNFPQGGGCNTTEHPRWEESTENGTNDYGFSALPGGSRINTSFTNLGNFGNWWTSTALSPTVSGVYYLSYSTGGLGSTYTNKWYGFSVRCLRD